MNFLTFATLFDAVYIVFILNYFKTKYSFAHPLTYFDNKFIYHPIGKSKIPVSNICPFGHLCSWFLAAFILIRLFLVYYTKISINLIKNMSYFVLIITILFSLMNFNAVIYLIPHFIIESFIIKNYLNR